MTASYMAYLRSMSTQALTTDVEVLSSQWSLLDHAQEWSDFSQVNDQSTNTWTSSVVFEGMHCTACAINIEEALMAVPGVLSAQISAASHRGRIVWSAQTTKPSHWMKAVAKLGYTTLPANDALANEMRRADARKMLWRLGHALGRPGLGSHIGLGLVAWLGAQPCALVLGRVHALVEHVSRQKHQEE